MKQMNTNMLIKNSTAKENISKCPDFCFTIDNVSGDIIKLKAGESGCYTLTPASLIQLHRLTGKHEPEGPMLDYLQRKDHNKVLARKFNEVFKVTEAQREAMEAGSMFGWGVPGANPDNYNEDGTICKDEESVSLTDEG